jgi:preprotein translocase subunit secB
VEKMDNNKEIESVLKLNKLVFDKIEFNRLGFKNDKDLELELQSSISERISKSKSDKESFYKVTLLLKGKKPDEYIMGIELSGFFSIEFDYEFKDELITKNSVAILMPYLRSQVSILTAQPEVESVVLPPFNINKMLDNK